MSESEMRRMDIKVRIVFNKGVILDREEVREMCEVLKQKNAKE
jgi:hypothetical protein